MTLSTYTDLIRCLPYLDQAFETKKATWQKACDENFPFSQYCDRVFQKDTIKLSRKNCFDIAQQDFDEALYSIIFWGYWRNMRGDNFSKVLNSMEKIRDAFSVRRDMTEAEFKVLRKKIKGTGIGPSTLTKLLYFFNYTLEGYQCLILDGRIVDVFNEKSFEELKQLSNLSETNKMSKYASYLAIMQNTAKLNGYMPDQLEFFLFHFGNNLKSDNG